MMMNPFSMVVWIVAICMVARVLTARYESRKAVRGGDGLDEQTRERLSRLPDLEKRVQVLEAIVTDRNYELRRKIDELDRVS